MNRRLLISLAVPILALATLATLKSIQFHTGREVRLKIMGFDPFDPLSGHYLRFQVSYGENASCPTSVKLKRDAYYCIDQKEIRSYRTSDCGFFIKGTCHKNRFTAGIERFYIPKENAKSLESAVTDKQGEIAVQVSGDGTALIKELYIEGKGWKTYIRELELNK